MRLALALLPLLFSCSTTKTQSTNMDASMQDAQADAGPCGGCSGATPLCDTATNACVACLSNNDCTDPSSSSCSNGTCVGCTSGMDCSHVPNTSVCDASDTTCVECTTATEATDCSGNSCNPTTRECTTTPIGSLGTCEACVADSECTQVGGTLRCVETSFNSATHGTYCLVQLSGSCTAPYDNALSATSVGGDMAAYCFPPPLTTCEAVLDFGEDCNIDSDCGAQGLADGLCRTTGFEDKCTYPCSFNTHCDGFSCSTAPTRYCCTGGAGAGCP